MNLNRAPNAAPRPLAAFKIQSRDDADVFECNINNSMGVMASNVRRSDHVTVRIYSAVQYVRVFISCCVGPLTHSEEALSQLREAFSPYTRP